MNAPSLWDLNDTQHWDVLTALRGCDCPSEASEALNSVTSAVIRYMAGYNGRHGSCLSPRVAKAVWGDASADEREGARRLWRENARFRSHVILAFRALCDWRVPGAEEYWAWVMEQLGPWWQKP